MKSKVVVFVAALTFQATAQVLYNGGVYTQDFNTLSNRTVYFPYTNMPDGWVVSRGSYVWSGATNGYSNNYGTYCFASASGVEDKSLSLVIGSTGAASCAARIRNNTGVTLNSFSLRYVVEQWVKGAVVNTDQVIPFEYSLTATNLTNGVYTGFPSLDMHSINDGDGVFSPLNGESAANRHEVTGTVTGLAWVPGQDLWIRWRGVSYAFYGAHALAVDDLEFWAVPNLQIALEGQSGLTVRWPTNHQGFRLVSALTPGGPGWDPVTNEVSVAGNQFIIQLDPTNSWRFFRLEQR
jgi:hypothetical protein